MDTPPTSTVSVTTGTMVRALAVAAAGWLAVQLWPVLLVITAALFLVGTLNPAVQHLEDTGLRRGWAIGVVFVGLFVFAGMLLGFTLPTLLEQIGSVFGREVELRHRLADELAHHSVTTALGQSLRRWQYPPLAETAAKAALAYSTRLLEILGYIASFIFLGLYMMIDRDRLRGALFASVPRTAHVRLSRIMLNLETIVGGYIRGQVLTSLGMALFTFALLLALGVDDALAIAVFAGAIDVLPYVGVLLAITPAVAAASAHGITAALTVLGAMIAYQEFESRILLPRIYGMSLRLPSSIILIALLTGGTLFGIPGALLALPVAAGLLMLIEELRVQLPGETADDGDLRRQDELLAREYQRRVDGLNAQEAAAIAVELSRDRQEK